MTRSVSSRPPRAPITSGLTVWKGADGWRISRWCIQAGQRYWEPPGESRWPKKAQALAARDEMLKKGAA